MTEFNLSEKIMRTNDEEWFDNIPIEDVKEFIRLLKDAWTGDWEHDKKSFDKLAGEELSNSSEGGKTK
jgi:hypothetical protein|tara:strand:- start:158 stop:361 length:204 start_codon:yes stop_codon:yes gene_type:complete